ncbi:MAG TPA: hypothetical protein VET45_06980 [Candidatus Binatia bacterium]|nr:hypothetical protein [Candidatus Binatia bacterium]
MKKITVIAILLALLVPGAAFAGSSTDAALGLGAFAVFNQIISGTGIFGGFRPAPQPVIVQPPVPQPVVVREYYPVYVQPPTYYAPVSYPPAHYAPARVVVIKERGWVPPGHARKGHYGYRWHGRDND